MPIRLPLLLAALSLVLLVPAAARAADYVPDEVIVRYEEGTGGGVAAQVAAEAGTEPVQALPGGSEQLTIDDGDSVRETIAELRQDPNVAYAVPNWRAHAAARGPERPRVPVPVELLRQLRHQRARSVGARRGARRARRPRRRGRRDRQRRGVRTPRPLPTRPGPPPLDVRAAVGLHRARPPSERHVRPRHACGGHHRPDDQQRASARRASPTTPRSCRCVCSTATARAIPPTSRVQSATPLAGART